jgi:hypothetical protein
VNCWRSFSRLNLLHESIAAFRGPHFSGLMLVEMVWSTGRSS